jgi:NAD+ diphosphatase
MVTPAVTHAALAYNGLALDRAAGRRGDPAWIRAVLARPGSRVIPFWRDSCLVRGAGGPQPVMLAAPEAAAVLEQADTCAFLGLDGEAGVFAADLSALDLEAATGLAGATGVLDVRRMVTSLDAAEAAALALARGVLRWNREQRFCGACGHPARSERGGMQRRCTGPDCDRLLFPRIEPAVIALVESPGPPRRCLLARHTGSATGAYATLAGFVEIGESLEDAVRREVAEETGVRVGEVTYQASQAWPFPAGLMVGFRARAVTEAIAVDETEIEEARWFTRGELTEYLSRAPASSGDSIESFLIGTWLRERD